MFCRLSDRCAFDPDHERVPFLIPAFSSFRGRGRITAHALGHHGADDGKVFADAVPADVLELRHDIVPAMQQDAARRVGYRPALTGRCSTSSTLAMEEPPPSASPLKRSLMTSAVPRWRNGPARPAHACRRQDLRSSRTAYRKAEADRLARQTARHLKDFDRIGGRAPQRKASKRRQGDSRRHRNRDDPPILPSPPLFPPHHLALRPRHFGFAAITRGAAV